MQYSEEELNQIGFKSFGKNVKISKQVSFYSPQNITIGDNVRIDDFCILSATNGFIILQNHIHIAGFCNLIGGGGIVMENYSGLSSRVSLYSCSDDYSGDFLIGPVMEEECLNIKKGKINLCKYVTIGTNSAVMPNVKLNEGSVLGAFSLATREIPEWEIHGGVPARRLKKRKKGLLNLVKYMEEKWN